MSVTGTRASAAQAVETGSIYDIGYRRYEGPRLGRAHAIRSLFGHTLRSSYGIGRGARAKLAPLTLGFLVCLPAIAIIAAQALFRQLPAGGALEDQLPVRFETYSGSIGIFVILFCAAQAPDHFGRDQRWHLLSLYFSRALRRTDYALARLAGFMVAVFLLGVLPLVLLFLGQVLLATDVLGRMIDDLPTFLRAVAQAAITAALLGGLSMAIAAFTPRRAYAVAGTIALFLIPNIVAQIVTEVGSGELGKWLLLVSPTAILEGTSAFVFDAPIRSQFAGYISELGAGPFVIAAAVEIAVAVVVAVRRFQRITA